MSDGSCHIVRDLMLEESAFERADALGAGVEIFSVGAPLHIGQREAAAQESNAIARAVRQHSKNQQAR